MKTLKDLIQESLLDDDEKLFVDTGSEAIKEQIEEFIKDNYEGDLKNIEITDDFIVNCKGHISFRSNKETTLTKGLFKWGNVDGDFDCSYRTQLTSLEGAPEKVGEVFSCVECRSLTTLKGAPKKVSGGFYCNHCKNLKSLEGAPKETDGDFDCNNCMSLKSLRGAPEKVGEGFYCHHCDCLKTLEGAPKEVNGDFNCSHCLNLKSFKGAPKEVDNFSCKYCTNLVSLEYAPKKVGGSFYSEGTNFSKSDIEKYSDVNKVIYSDPNLDVNKVIYLSNY